MSKFYNITLCNRVDTFIPRIPYESSLLLEGENKDIPRICLSKTIEGCLSAVPWGGNDLENYFDEDENENEGISIYVHEFDSKDIIKENLIQPHKLYRKDWVRDAMHTKEYWVINQELIPSKIYEIRLTSWDEYCEDSLSYKELQDFKKSEIDYSNIWNGGIYILIRDIKYEIVRTIK